MKHLKKNVKRLFGLKICSVFEFLYFVCFYSVTLSITSPSQIPKPMPLSQHDSSFQQKDAVIKKTQQERFIKLKNAL
jgi:hypothetical protein